MTKPTVASLKEEVDSMSAESKEMGAMLSETSTSLKALSNKITSLSVDHGFIKSEVDQIKSSLRKEFEYQNRRHSELTRTVLNLENRISELCSSEEKESLTEVFGADKKEVFSTVIFGFKVTVTKEKI